MAAGVVGMRIPLDGVESLRQPVRLRRLYYGSADASETLRRLTTDSALAKALPNAADERNVLAVPVTCRDRVVAVLTAWGPGCSPVLGPILEVVAAMLAAAWSTELQPGSDGSRPNPPPCPTRSCGASSKRCSPAAGSSRRCSRSSASSTTRSSPTRRSHATHHWPASGTPDELFASAASLNIQSAVDLACVRAALYGPRTSARPTSSSTCSSGRSSISAAWPRSTRRSRDSRVDPASIVLEFSEREPVPDLALLQRIAAELRARGFRIAVDDAGAGHASMRVIAELRPEFIKVDRSLIQAIDADRARRALVVALLSFSGHIGARVIAEGIETAA